MIGVYPVDSQEAAEDAREARARDKMPYVKAYSSFWDHAREALGTRECPGCMRAVNRAQRSCGACGWEFSAVEG
ncbi:MAG: hypothetical protein O7A04_06790 [Acidobacteria bacterium]|nr:hypothetical protein [Acidobacteriota bacterium]